MFVPVEKVPGCILACVTRRKLHQNTVRVLHDTWYLVVSENSFSTYHISYLHTHTLLFSDTCKLWERAV